MGHLFSFLGNQLRSFPKPLLAILASPIPLLALVLSFSAFGAPPEVVSGVYKVVGSEVREGTQWTLFQKKGDLAPSLTIKTHIKPEALQLNAEYELQAEVLRRSPELAEASQVLVFFSTAQGKTPVFILSTETPTAHITGQFLRLDYPGFFTL